jgi:hypothetical protein
MTTCQVCATPLPAGSRYCHTCGTQVSEPGVPGADPPGNAGPGDAAPGGAGLGDAGGPEPSRAAEELLARIRALLGDEYEVDREIGRGGMGIVYLARETALDRHVAIKVLPPAFAFDPQIVERFVREARLAARLDHPSVIPIYRVGQREELTYFVMKYVAGGSLARLLKNTPQLPVTEAQRILVACAHALGYAHAHDIVHRDVKPANILLDTGGRVYVSDLGIAKAVSSEASLTRSGAVIGTPLYMSPEQCRGQPADARSDQYALALVGYQMLAGKLPFEQTSMEGIVYDRLFTDPEPLETARPDVPPHLSAAIHRALRREPDERFPTMEDFAQALLGAGDVAETTPVGKTVPIRTGERPRPAPAAPRGRARAPAIAAATLLVAAAGATAAWWAFRTQVGGRTGAQEAGETGVPAAETATRAPAASVEPAAGVPPTQEPGPAAEPEPAAEPGPAEPAAARTGAAPGRSQGPTELAPPPAARDEPRPEPAPAETRPPAREPPQPVLAAIRLFLTEGRALHEEGRYVDAVGQYRRGLELVADAERTYTRTRDLVGLRDTLLREIERSVQACELEGQPQCPRR